MWYWVKQAFILKQNSDLCIFHAKESIYSDSVFLHLPCFQYITTCLEDTVSLVKKGI